MLGNTNTPEDDMQEGTGGRLDIIMHSRSKLNEDLKTPTTRRLDSNESDYGYQDDNNYQQPPRKRRRTNTNNSRRARQSADVRYHNPRPSKSKTPAMNGKEVDEITALLGYVRSINDVTSIEVDASLGYLEPLEDSPDRDESNLGDNPDDFAYSCKFHKGVTHEDFQNILDFLFKDEHKTCEESSFIEYIYTDEETGKIKISVDVATNVCLNAVVSHNHTGVNLETRDRLPYDCHVSIFTKDIWKHPHEVTELPENPKSKKEKKCWEFYKHRNIWKILLTEVITWTSKPIEDVEEKSEEIPSNEEEQENDQQNKQTESPEYDDDGLRKIDKIVYEIRFELMQDVLESVTTSDDANLRNIAGKFWQTINFFSNLVNKKKPNQRGMASTNMYRTTRTRIHGNDDGLSFSPNSSRYSGKLVSPGSASQSPFHSPPFIDFNQSPVNYTAKRPLSVGDKLFPELNLQALGLQETQKLQHVCFEMVTGSGGHGKLGFPGALPMNFSRKYWNKIQTREYYVSEKTDGIRYMLYVSDSGVFFFDRSFKFYMIPDCESLVDIYGKSGGTLLDGEMVRHETDDKPFYLVFDVVTINGRRVAKEYLSERLKLIRDEVVVPYRKAVEERKLENSHPFVIIAKQFFHKKWTKKLFDQIHTTPPKTTSSPAATDEPKTKRLRTRYYKDDKRYHKTDGVIFTPNASYTPFSDTNLFKWKYRDLNTIDFRLTLKSGRGGKDKEKWMLTCRGEKTEALDCAVAEFPSEDMERLKEDLKSLNLGTPQHGSAADDTGLVEGLIVECNYDPESGLWRYYSLRSDKKVPNFYRVVLDTILSITDNITQEEIVYRSVVKPSDDHWVVARNCKMEVSGAGHSGSQNGKTTSSGKK